MGLLDRLRGLVTPSVVEADLDATREAPWTRARRAPDALRTELGAAGVPTDLAELVAAHGDWLAETLPQTHRRADWDVYRAQEVKLAGRLKSADDQQLRAAATLALVRVRREPDFRYGNLAADALVRLGRRKMAWTPEQVGWLLTCTDELAREGSRDRAAEVAQLAVGAAERLDADAQPALTDVLRSLAAGLEGTTAAGARTVARVHVLLDRTGEKDPTVLPETVLPLDDRYGGLARTALADRHPDELVVTAVTHLGSYGGSVVPTQRWRSRTEQLLAAQPATADVAATLLETVLTHQDHTRARVYGAITYEEPFFVDQGTAQLLRAAVWTVALAPDRSGRLALLGAAAVHCGVRHGGRGADARLSAVTTSTVAALAEIAETATDPSDVVGQLARVRTKVSNKPIRKAVDAALGRAASAGGMTPGQLLEQAVPDLGLDADGTAEVVVGAHTALLALEGGAAGPRLTVRWRTPAGKVVAGVPAQLKAEHPEQLAELRTRAKEAKTAVAVQRARVEDLLASGRTWPGSGWRAHYVEHPVVGLTARSLLWQVRPPAQHEARAGEDGWSGGLPEATDDGWLLRRHDGTTAEVGDDDEVRLWHPLQQPLAEVQAWRAHLSDRSFRQPFKQAFREIYLLTPAEVATGTYSNRFAGHILRYPQAGALMRNRGWSGSHLGYWDGGEDGQATKELEGGWRASFFYDTVENDADQYGQVSLCSTDQVRFERYEGPRTGGGSTAQPLTEVPALVLSEALRDVDLFVGVTSVAADPEWVDRGTDRVQAYWQRESFGDLGESAQLRREALGRLLPRTKIADRAELSGRFLVVHGHLRDYKIHLGSGNILMSPADTYLCIVPARDDAATKKVYLPFEADGGKLAVILSKAFLLAEDTAITDPSITRQLRRGL